MAQYGKRGCVSQSAAQTKHNAICEVQGSDILSAERREQQAPRGEHATNEGGQTETDLVRQAAGDGR